MESLRKILSKLINPLNHALASLLKNFLLKIVLKGLNKNFTQTILARTIEIIPSQTFIEVFKIFYNYQKKLNTNKNTKINIII